MRLGDACTSSLPGSPSKAAISSASAELSSVRSWRASSRRISSAVARTPTSARISASSSRSHAAASPGSNAADAISAVSARRLFVSESRRREKRPLRSDSGSGRAFSSPSSSAQDLAIRRTVAIGKSRASPSLRDGRGFFARQTTRHDLGDAVGAHRDAVEDVGGFHRPLLVSDDDELGAIGVPSQELDEATDVRIVESGLDLVEQVEGTRPREKEREQERDRAEGLLAAG